MSRRLSLLVALGLLTFPVLDGSGRVSLSAQTSDAGCWLASLGGGGGGIRLLDSSGNAALDRALQQETMLAAQTFLVTVRGFFYDDGRSPNAFATSQRVDQYGPDGTFVLGLRLLQSELAEAQGEVFAVAAIMAHEFAHLAQFKREGGRRTRHRTKVWELHADYLAGWYLARRGRYAFTDVRPALQSFFEKGDYQFNSPHHHGTPRERLMAIENGFNTAVHPLGFAYSSGLNLATELDTSIPISETRATPPTAAGILDGCEGLCASFDALTTSYANVCRGGRYQGPVPRIGGSVGQILHVDCDDQMVEVEVMFEGLTRRAFHELLFRCAGTGCGTPLTRRDQGVLIERNGLFLELFSVGEDRRLAGERWITGVRAVLAFGRSPA